MFSGALEILWGSLLRQIYHLKMLGNMNFFRILVRLNNHEGLKEDIEIEHKNISIIQTWTMRGVHLGVGGVINTTIFEVHPS